MPPRALGTVHLLETAQLPGAARLGFGRFGWLGGGGVAGLSVFAAECRVEDVAPATEPVAAPASTAERRVEEVAPTRRSWRLAASTADAACRPWPTW